MTQAPEQTSAWRLFQLLLLTTAAFASTYGRFTLGSLQETLRLNLDLSDNEVALLQGPAMAIPMVLCSIPAGLLADRCSRARLFVVFALLSLVATVLTAFATGFLPLFLARCLAGIASAATLVLTFSVLSDLYGPEQRGRATMVTLFGEIGGAPAAFALGGMLLTLLGPMSGEGLENWRWALLWMCIPLMPPVVLLLMLREPPRTGIMVERPPLSQVWPRLQKYRAVIVPLLLARIMVWIADGAVLVWAAPSFARQFALPPDRIGAIMGAALLIGALLGPILGGPLADLCQRSGGPRRTMSMMCMVASLSVPAALFAIMPYPVLASVMLTVFLTLGFVIGTAAMALATIVIPGELRGVYIAITVSVAAIFSIGVAPLAVSGLSGVLGGPAEIGRALAIVCASTSVLGSIVFAVGRRGFLSTIKQEGHSVELPRSLQGAPSTE